MSVCHCEIAVSPRSSLAGLLAPLLFDSPTLPDPGKAEIREGEQASRRKGMRMLDSSQRLSLAPSCSRRANNGTQMY